VYCELTRAVGRPETSVADIANIVRRDGAMSVKVLQLVNSSYFGLRQRIASIHQAVAYLGVEVVKALALTAHAFAAVEAELGPELELLTAEALGVARICKRLLTDPRHADDGFTAGLLHDIGKIVLAVLFPERYAQATATARATGRSIETVEKELIGLTHASAGAYLLGMWGLPFPIVEVAAYHHDPAAVTDGDRTVMAAVHVADALVAKARLDGAFLEEAGLGDELPRWQRVIDEEMKSAG
jgi:HD-like signal output (HDOD) protein